MNIYIFYYLIKYGLFSQKHKNIFNEKYFFSFHYSSEKKNLDEYEQQAYRTPIF